VWAVVAGRPTWSLLRAWMVGVACDLIDPASIIFHTVAYSVFAVIFLPLRGAIHRRRAAAWSGMAAALSLILHVADRVLVGVPLGGDFARGMLSAGCTALVILPLGWLLGGLPNVLRPIESGGA
jgi:hypothetical protein